MGREVRMVPADWQHPKDNREIYIPLHGSRYEDVARDWREGLAHWLNGKQQKYPDGLEDHNEPRTETAWAEYYGDYPQASDYMPDWPAAERTHYMMYEDCTEGTPISPAFATADELAHWLADTGASAFGGMTASYEGWIATINRGFAMSMVMTNGVAQSGVEAMAELDSQK